MVLRRPRRLRTDAFQPGRHPVLLLVHPLLDVRAGDAAVLVGPLHCFLHVVPGADAAVNAPACRSSSDRRPGLCRAPASSTSAFRAAAAITHTTPSADLPAAFIR